MIRDVPLDKPVTTPVELPTVATLVVLLLHEPPVVLFDKVMVEPSQRAVGPVMGPGAEVSTVMSAKLTQPL